MSMPFFLSVPIPVMVLYQKTFLLSGRIFTGEPKLSGLQKLKTDGKYQEQRVAEKRVLDKNYKLL